MFTGNLELDLLPHRTRGIAHQARETIEDLPNRHHPTSDYVRLHLADEPAGTLHRILKRLGAQLIRQGFQFAAQDHQLAHQVHQCIEAADVNAQATAV